MPLLREPTKQELEDHFFGSGAFEFGWLAYKFLGKPDHFPVQVIEVDPYDGAFIGEPLMFTEVTFVEGIKKYAETLLDRTFDDLIEDMDAVDVDNCIQFAMFDEIRYS